MTASPSSDPRFRHLVRRLHALGPRPTGELLLVVAGDRERLFERLEHLAQFDPEFARLMGAHDWIETLWAVPA